MQKYCPSITSYKRFKTREVNVGDVTIGGNNPIVLQSMTTSDTMDTEKVVQECIEIIEAGGQLIRLTTPSIKEANHLDEIKNNLATKGYTTPLIADVHFTPNAAEIAALKVEKVRINPGNYSEKKIKIGGEYSANDYKNALQKLTDKFIPLVRICKQYNRALRIGTNHGSLSDRILSKYGDTPEGMVESAMEFIRICAQEDFHNLVISMKSSNPLVMVHTYRLLVATMLKEGYNYPLHLGVTEAGDGEDGRIKSALGIGALLEDGLGDTIRVSLTEPAAHEIPVAKKISARYSNKTNSSYSNYELYYDPYHYTKRETFSIQNIGSTHVPIVIQQISERKAISRASLFPFGYTYRVNEDKWHILDHACDYLYIGTQTLDFEIPSNLGILQDLSTWVKNGKEKVRHYPVLPIHEIDKLEEYNRSKIYFISITEKEIKEIIRLKDHPLFAMFVLLYQPSLPNAVYSSRYFFKKLHENEIKNPVILYNTQTTKDYESFQIDTTIELGTLLLDGFGEGIFIDTQQWSPIQINSTSFGILQATRTRISKTEYISCPSCGRTLFDLQETTARIKNATQHLKGLKIGIMGCIVNGPGEMADADYGYVGSGPGKINLYKKREVIKRNVSTEKAVEELIAIIKLHGDWSELEK